MRIWNNTTFIWLLVVPKYHTQKASDWYLALLISRNCIIDMNARIGKNVVIANNKVSEVTSIAAKKLVCSSIQGVVTMASTFYDRVSKRLITRKRGTT